MGRIIRYLEKEVVEACRRGDLEEVKKALNSGLGVNERGEGTLTLIFHAAESGQLDLVKWLVENGAKINIPVQSEIDWDESDTLLTRCSRKNGVTAEIYQYLISKGAVR